MNVSAEAVANRLLEFAENSGLPMYNLKLQKLVYIAHGFSLALLDKPLICNHVKACQFGPTYPELYENFGSMVRDASLDVFRPKIPLRQALSLTQSSTAYGRLSVRQAEVNYPPAPVLLALLGLGRGKRKNMQISLMSGLKVTIKGYFRKLHE